MRGTTGCTRPIATCAYRKRGSIRGQHRGDQQSTMSDHTYRVTEIVGSSTEGIDDAIRNAITRANQTLRNLDWFEVTQIRGHVEEGADRTLPGRPQSRIPSRRRLGAPTKGKAPSRVGVLRQRAKRPRGHRSAASRRSNWSGVATRGGQGRAHV